MKTQFAVSTGLAAFWVSAAATVAAQTPAWTNIRVTPPCDGLALKCMLAINPAQPWNLVAGAVDRSGTNCGALVGQVAAFCSTDGGNTWTKPANGMSVSGVPWCDQTLAFGPNGRVVSTSLLNTGCLGTGQCAIAAFASGDGGANWTTSDSTGAGAATVDRPWIACDTVPGSPYAGRFYLSWDQWTSVEANVLAFSTDAGASWSGLQSVKTDMQFPSEAVGVGGALFVAGADDITWQTEYVNVSTDGGQTFSSHTAYMFQSATGFPCPTSGYTGVPYENMTTAGLDADRSLGPNGRVYLAVIDKRSGQSHYHVWVVSSDDVGQTWSAPVQADDDLADAREHAFPSLAVSPGAGDVHVFYYDYVAGAGGSLSYRQEIASSEDHGITWHSMTVQDASAALVADPGAPGWQGDYAVGGATDRVIYPLWADGRDGGVARAYVQPVPNPMPWVSSVGPPATMGTPGVVTLMGGNLAPTITPYAVAFDDPAVTGTITNVTGNAVTVNVNVGLTASLGPHEWSLRYGVPVASVTVAAAVKSGWQHPLVVVCGSCTPTEVSTPIPTYTSISSVVVSPNPVRRESSAVVSFERLPEGARVQVYDLSGERVALLVANAEGRAWWDLVARTGNPVARGIYMFVVECQGRRYAGTLGVL